MAEGAERRDPIEEQIHREEEIDALMRLAAEVAALAADHGTDTLKAASAELTPLPGTGMD